MEPTVLLGGQRKGNLFKENGGMKMAYFITDDCDCCGDCLDACDYDAIAARSPKYMIDSELCVDCGDCADVCPQNAIVKEENQGGGDS